MDYSDYTQNLICCCPQWFVKCAPHDQLMSEGWKLEIITLYKGLGHKPFINLTTGIYQIGILLYNSTKLLY